MKKRSSLAALLSFLGGGWPWLALAIVLTLGDKLLDSLGFSAVVTSIANGALARDAALVARATLWLVGLGIGRSILMSLAGLVLARAAEGAVRRIRRGVVARSLGASEQAESLPQPGQTVAILTNDIELAKQGYSQLVNAIGQVFVVLTVFVALSLWQWPVAVTTAVMALACFISTGGFAGPLKRLGAAYQAKLAVVTDTAASLMNGMTVIKSMRAEGTMLSRFRRTVAEHFNVGQRRGTLLAWQSLAGNGVPWLALAGLIATTGALALRGALPVGSAIGLVQLGTRALFPLAMLGSVWAGLQASLAAVDRVTEALRVPQEEAGAAHARDGAARGTGAVGDSAQDADGTPGLAFDDVSFSYADRPILTGLTFAAPAGGRMMLRGPSGSGKTTAMKLMLGLCRPQAGEIRIAGRRAGSLPSAELRRLTAYVPQEPWLFPGTIRANIALGKPDASDAEIAAVAQAAHAHDFVARLPQGYDTVLDERGSNLSGGERQRLCLARALLKDAPVLLLDEATSAVDAESERLIRAAIDGLGRARTVVTVSHTGEMGRDADVTVALG